MKALSSLLLVVATAAMGLGMAALTASLLPAAGAHPGAWERQPIGRDVSLEPGAAQLDADGARRRPWKTPGTPGGIATPAELPRGSVARPWVSPLYPQNGVTLWDRVRVSSQRRPPGLPAWHSDPSPCASGGCNSRDGNGAPASNGARLASPSPIFELSDPWHLACDALSETSC